ncbi:hypothetical protein QJQ45_029834 [Haematococcus lacustris]|nr:hypothetical protein QJQ45_029834 [Haematococcus lacustris]
MQLKQLTRIHPAALRRFLWLVLVTMRLRAVLLLIRVTFDLTCATADSITGGNPASENVQLQRCLSLSASQVVEQVANQLSNTSREAIVRSITSELAALGRRCFKANVTVYRPIRVLVPLVESYPVWQRRAAEFEATTGIPVVLDTVPFFSSAVEMNTELQSSPMRDGWIMDPSLTGTVALYKAFADLGPLIGRVPESMLQYNDILPFYRLVSGVYNKKIIGLPLDGDNFLLYYRLDLFQRYQLDVPQTWSDLLDMARLMNGTDTDGDGRPDLFGACLDMMPQCKISFFVAGIAASYIQNRGTQSGFWFDPDSDGSLMRPLVGNNEAMHTVLQLLARLQAYMPSERTCSRANPAFLAGKCLMTIDWGGVFKSAPNSNISQPGMLGIAPLPGSTQILDRTTLKLVNCTPALCPMAQPYRTTRLAPNVTHTLPGAWVNTAPFPAFGGWTAGVSDTSPFDVQMITLVFFAYLTSPDNSWADVLNKTDSVDPFRQQHLDPANIGRWTAAGYDQGTTLQYLSALSMAMSSPNVALDSRMAFDARTGRSYHSALEAAYLAVPSHNITSALLEFRRQYGYLLGRAAPVFPPPPLPFASSSIQNVDSTTIAVASACLGGGLLLLVGLGLFAWQRVVWLRRNHRSALGKLLPPGAGPDTTLVLTDVQDSTTLYECLPVEVMDACMRIAERIIRDLLAAHQGYESATEGDAFLCAFHSPLDAVLFCLKLQDALLHATWPQELLHCPDVPCCHLVTVSLSPQFSKIVQMATLSSQKRLSSFTPQGFSLARRILRGVRKCLVPQIHHDDNAPPPGHPCPTTPTSALAQDSLLTTRLSKRAQQGGVMTNGRGHQLIMSRQRSILQPNQGPLLFTPDDWLAWSEQQSDEPVTLSRPTHDAILAHRDIRDLYNVNMAARVSYEGISSAGDLTMSMELPVLESKAGQPGASHVGSVFQLVTAHQTPPVLAPVAATTLSSALTQALDSQLRPHQGDAATPSCLVFSGLRIRCGVHTGVASAQDVSYNTSSARMQYSGAPLALARAVCDAAQGAQILLSQACFAALPQQQLRDAVSLAWPPSRHSSRKLNIGNENRQVSHSHLESKAAGPATSTSTQKGIEDPAAMAGGDDRQLPYSSLLIWHVGEFIFKVGSVPTTAQVVSMPADGDQQASLDAVLVSIGSREDKSRRISFETTRSQPSKKSLRWDSQQATMDAAPHQLLGQRAKNAARRSSLALVAAENCTSPEAAEALHSKPGQQVHSLYSVLPAGLAPRLVLLGAPRAVRQTVPGALSAPYGSACVCFLYVVGLAELLAWDPQEAASALALFSALIKQQLMAWNGYLVEHVDGFVLAAFACPVSALRWACICQEHLKQLPWSDGLLAHPLTELLITAEMSSNGEARQTLVYRGLRIKVGADVGAVRTSLHPVTGVMAFRGRVMNRAARIASRAGSGQVLCSAAVWAHWAGNSALATDGLPSRAVLGSTPELGSEGEQLLPRLTAVSQGLVPLKGVPEPVEVMQVKLVPESFGALSTGVSLCHPSLMDTL